MNYAVSTVTRPTGQTDVQIARGRPVGWRLIFTCLRPLAVVFDFLRRFGEGIEGAACASRFASCGVNVAFDPRGTYSFGTIHLGDSVNLGARPTLVATRSEIRIGNHVMFGPEVVIRGGNHRMDLVGRYLDDVKDSDKRAEDDAGVTIEDDVWVGQRAIILGGVTVGRGAVIAAGAVVTNSVPPYAIVGGNPARVIRMRFEPEQIHEHEQLLGLRPGAVQ